MTKVDLIVLEDACTKTSSNCDEQKQAQHSAGAIFSRPSKLLAMVLLAAMCLGALLVARNAPATGRSSESRFLQAASTLSEEMQQVLDQHNVYRCMHGVSLLTWDPQIAEQAQAWADGGNYGHSSWNQRLPACQGHSPKGCGENIAWGWPTRSGEDVTIAWYSEIEETNPYGIVTAGTNPGTLHYTQIVWEKTTKLGCGKGRITRFGREGDFWVCQYGPAGNYGGQFEANVHAPTQSVQTCGGSNSDIPCGYAAFSDTAVYFQGTGGTKLYRNWFESDDNYLQACKDNCNADSTCGGFVDDPTDARGRMCKPKTASSGYSKSGKTFYKKGDGC